MNQVINACGIKITKLSKKFSKHSTLVFVYIKYNMYISLLKL
jgi:hypothetical protein